MRPAELWMRFSRVWMRSSRWMRSNRCWWDLAEWMRSSRWGWDLAKCGWDLAECGWYIDEWIDQAELERPNDNAKVATDLGSNPSILRHSGIWGAADEEVLNIVHEKIQKIPCYILYFCAVVRDVIIVYKRYNNYLCTCDLYSPVHNVLDACIYNIYEENLIFFFISVNHCSDMD